MICPHCNFDNYAGEEVCERCLHDLTQIDTTPRPKNEVHRSLIEDPVSKLAPPPYAPCRPQETILSAAHLMKKSRVGCVIVEENRIPLGIFTERDMLMKVIGRSVDPNQATVRQFMTSPVEAVRASDSLAYVLNKMSIGGYRHVPIVDDAGHVSGVISVRTILRYLANQLS